MEEPQSPQRGEELRRFSHLPAQRLRAGVGPLDLGCRPALWWRSGAGPGRFAGPVPAGRAREYPATSRAAPAPAAPARRPPDWQRGGRHSAPPAGNSRRPARNPAPPPRATPARRPRPRSSPRNSPAAPAPPPRSTTPAASAAARRTGRSDTARGRSGTAASGSGRGTRARRRSRTKACTRSSRFQLLLDLGGIQRQRLGHHRRVELVALHARGHQQAPVLFAELIDLPLDHAPHRLGQLALRGRGGIAPAPSGPAPGRSPAGRAGGAAGRP